MEISKQAVIDQGVLQGWLLAPTLFYINIDDVINKSQDVLYKHFKINDSTLDTMIFADDQIVLSVSEDDLQRRVYLLEKL